MSKLIDRLNQTMKGTSRSLGFQVTPTAATKPKIRLLARVSKVVNPRQLAEETDGADGLLIYLPKADAGTLKTVAEAIGDMPWGWRLEDSPGGNVKKGLKGGADFIIFSSDAAFYVPEAEGTGRILEVESSLSEGMVRAINELPVDAVLATEKLLSETRDLDYTTAVTEFQQAQNALQANLMTGAQLLNISLLDFLR